MDDDPVDTKPTIEEACKPGCSQVRSAARLVGRRRDVLWRRVLALPDHARGRCALYGGSRLLLGCCCLCVCVCVCVPATNPCSVTCCYRRWAIGGNGYCALLLPRSQRWAGYEACIKRVAASGDEEAHCTGQYLDFWKCVDACVRWDPPRYPLDIPPIGLCSAACVLRAASHDNDAFSTTFRPRVEETLLLLMSTRRVLPTRLFRLRHPSLFM